MSNQPKTYLEVLTEIKKRVEESVEQIEPFDQDLRERDRVAVALDAALQEIYREIIIRTRRDK